MSDSLEKARRELNICTMCNHPECIHRMSVLSRLEAAAREEGLRFAADEAKARAIQGRKLATAMRHQEDELHREVYDYAALQLENLAGDLRRSRQ